MTMTFEPRNSPGTDAPVTGRLATRAPFHLEATVRVLQRRPQNRVDVWDADSYWRVLAMADGLVLAQVENRGTIDDPDVRFTIRSGRDSPAARVAVEHSLRQILGLDLDPRPLQRLSVAERALRPTALALRGMRPPRFATLLEAFASVVPFQQLSLDAGVVIVGRIVERFGTSLEHNGQRFHAFPTARALAHARLETLQKCGLSASKAKSLREIARAIESGTVSEAKLSCLQTKEALTRLTELPGIGPWSAAVVLLRGLGRLEVFPPGDVGAMRGLRALMHLGPRASLGSAIARFGGYRGYLYFCALGGSLVAKGLIHAAPE